MNGMGRPEQIDMFKSFEADLAILPELKQKNIDALCPTDAVWITNNHTNKIPKGLGVLSFNQTRLTELERDEDMEIYIPFSVQSPKYAFDLLAVWNFYFECKQGRFKGVKGENCLEWSAIRKYTAEFGEDCLFGGDWNFGPTFSQPAFLEMCQMFENAGSHSLYHEANNLDWASSNHMTFKSPSKSYHHLDHFFGSKSFTANMINYEIPPVDDAVLSDHSPVILTLK